MIMKPFLSFLLCFALLFSACSAPARAELTGGWSVCPQEAAELPEDAAAAFSKATDGLLGVNYVPLSLLATQVVAGTNYCILCQATVVAPDARPFLALMYVHADLAGNASVLDIVPLEVGVPERAEEAGEGET